MRGDVPADDSKHFLRGQLVLLPLVHLFPCGVPGRFLVAEFRDQSLRLADIPVQLGVYLQLVHVLGKSVLEQFKLFLVDPVGLAHQVETQPVFHSPCPADAFFQFFHRYEFLRAVSPHPDVDRFTEKYHNLRIEIMDSGCGKG